MSDYCGKNNPLCGGMQLHGECYGRPSCENSRFEWVGPGVYRAVKPRKKYTRKVPSPKRGS